MPSGSHRGGGGSHFSGGGSSRGGGSHFGGGGFGGGHHYGHHRHYGFWRPFYRGPRYFYWGSRSYYISPVRQSVISFLSFIIFIGIFLAIMGFVIMSGADTNIGKIESDYQYYQQMISDAERNTALIKTAVVTDKFVNDRIDGEYDYWYLIYELETAAGGALEGETFSVYTFAQAAQFTVGTEIKVAVNNATVNSSTDSVPMDYKNMPLSRDGEWVAANNSHSTGKNILIFTGAAAAASILVSVVLSFLKQKANPDGDAETVENSTDSIGGGTVTHTESRSDNNYCSSCGARIYPGEKHCSSCGRRV